MRRLTHGGDPLALVARRAAAREQHRRCPRAHCGMVDGEGEHGRVPVVVMRGVAFVLLHAAIVGAYLRGLCTVLPPLEGEGEGAFRFVVAPVVAIAVAALTALYVVVRRLDSHGARLVALLITAWAAMIVYALFLTAALAPAIPILFIPFALVVQAIYGAPLLAGVAVSCKLTSRWLIARPVTRWS